ncbi:MAG: hypothetical protein ABFR36_08770 [Acidobacteriota bacterium]
MMKNISILVVFLLIFSISFMYSGEKQDLWLKAVSEKDGKTRLQLLEDFSAKYGTDKRFFKNLNINLTKTSYMVRDFDKTIEYGEKVISIEELEDNYKIEMYIYLANSYNVTKRDVDKAYQYAGLVVDLATKIKKSFGEDSKLKNQINSIYLAPALSIQSLILYSKGKDDPESLKNALEKSLESFEFDASKRTEKRIFSFAIALYKKDPTKIDDSLSAVEKLFSTSEEPNARYAFMIGQWYQKKKDRENAVKYMSTAYNANRKSNIATKLGQLLHKTAPEKAVEYFAEAFLLDDSDTESNAYKYLRHLWYNQIAKGKPQAEQDKGFDDIINNAKSRLNPDAEEETEEPDSTEEDETVTDNK